MSDKPQSGITISDENIGIGNLTMTDNAPLSFSFVGTDFKKLFTIHPDGKIERGEAFTTTDEMSLEFWRIIDQQRGGAEPFVIEIGTGDWTCPDCGEAIKRAVKTCGHCGSIRGVPSAKFDAR